jgi:hypothetical protein
LTDVVWQEMVPLPPKLSMDDTEKPALKPANGNPWYCLATLHGEQPMERWDQELAQKNRMVWDRWISTSMSAEQRDELATNFARRTAPKSLTLPEPNTPVDFSHTRFDRPVNFVDFRFPVPADFRSATFSHDANFEAAQFNNKTDFSSATFCRNAKFDRAHFNGGSDFHSATFSKSVDFQYVPDFANANFRRCACEWDGSG